MFAEQNSTIQSRIVLPRNHVHSLHLQLRRDFLEALHARGMLVLVFAVMAEVAREDYKVRLLR